MKLQVLALFRRLSREILAISMTHNGFDEGPISPRKKFVFSRDQIDIGGAEDRCEVDNPKWVFSPRDADIVNNPRSQSQQDTVDNVGAAPCLEADVQSKPRSIELFLNQVPRGGVSRQENEPAVAQIRQRNGLVLVQKVAPRKD
jgi:hypothetical protein